MKYIQIHLQVKMIGSPPKAGYDDTIDTGPIFFACPLYRTSMLTSRKRQWDHLGATAPAGTPEMDVSFCSSFR